MKRRLLVFVVVFVAVMFLLAKSLAALDASGTVVLGTIMAFLVLFAYLAFTLFRCPACGCSVRFIFSPRATYADLRRCHHCRHEW
jgi:hypothetical protein